MLRIVSIVAALVLPSLAMAQTPSSRPGAGAADAQLANITGRPKNSLLATDVAGAPSAPGAAGKTYGPDIAAMLFAPVGVILAPINEGLHAIDEKVAPVNAALTPITGPIDRALFAPAPTPEVVPAVVAKR